MDTLGWKKIVCEIKGTEPATGGRGCRSGVGVAGEGPQCPVGGAANRVISVDLTMHLSETSMHQTAVIIQCP